MLKVFLLAFVLNLLWENLHARLYTHYKGKPITRGLLVRAALFDALVITLALVIFENILIAALVLLVFAILLERWALATNRWAYRTSMPIIPLFNTGLSPTIQLVVTSYLIGFIL